MEKRHRLRLLWLTAACFALSLAGACQGQKQEQGKIEWIKSYGEGMKLAKSTRRPVMLFFTANWCGYCRKLIQEVYSNDSVAKESKRFVNIWINIDEDRKTPAEYGIRGVPTVFFLDPDGQTAMLYTGPRTPEHFARVMDMLAANQAKGS